MSQVPVFAMFFTFASLLNCQGAPTTRHSPTVSPLPPSSNSNSRTTLTKTIVPPAKVQAPRPKTTKGKNALSTTQNCNFPVLSSSIIAVRKLYSERARNFLQITRNGQVSGTDDETSTAAVLELESVGPRVIRIRGKETNLYLSMDSKGKLTAKKTHDSKSVFVIISTKDGFIAYQSNIYCTKFIALKWNGHLKRGHKVNKNHHSTHFLELNRKPPMKPDE